MPDVDLNLLLALDALLSESSVTGAAQRLSLSTSAMSRTLKRLPAATGDPLLVRAGRRLVPTPYAARIRNHVHALTRDVHTVLQPSTDTFDPASLRQTFTIRANDAFNDVFAVPLLQAVAEQAPHVRLCFVPKPDKDPAPLREASIDLDIGVVNASAPEMHIRTLFRDRFVGVVRPGHPLLDKPRITAEAYAACQHVVTSRKGRFHGPVDKALETLGLERHIQTVVPTFAHALRIARDTDLIAQVPLSCLDETPVDAATESPAVTHFNLPVTPPALTVSMMWHPRVSHDPAQCWLRHIVASKCGCAA